jgi:hypothetical protein
MGSLRSLYSEGRQDELTLSLGLEMNQLGRPIGYHFMYKEWYCKLVITSHPFAPGAWTILLFGSRNSLPNPEDSGRSMLMHHAEWMFNYVESPDSLAQGSYEIMHYPSAETIFLDLVGRLRRNKFSDKRFFALHMTLVKFKNPDLVRDLFV